MKKQYKHKAAPRNEGVGGAERLLLLEQRTHDYVRTHRTRNILHPPKPPLQFTPLLACDPDTPAQVLWKIAKEAPALRRWLVANPNADAALLEYISQTGGPGVKEALEILLVSLE